eukprot:Hpha_TRINITY_DN16990_c1_g1::TRINITY_DN16990_c1_g1_i17::g.51805::m.51805
MEGLEADVRELRAELQAVACKLQAAEQGGRETSAELSAVRNGEASAMKRLAEKDKEVASAAEAARQSAAEASRAQTEKASLEGRVAEMSQRLREAEVRFLEAQSAAASRLTETEAVWTKRAGEAATALEKAEKEAAGAKAEVGQREAEVAELTKKLDSEAKKSVKTAKAKEEAARRQEALEGQLAQAQKELAVAAAEAMRQEGLVRAAREQETQLRRFAEEEGSARRTAEAEARAVRKLVVSMNADRAAEASVEPATAKRISVLSESVSVLGSEVAEANDSSARSAAVIEELRAECDTLRRRLADAERSLVAREAELAKSAEQQKQLQEQLASALSSVKTTGEERDALRSEISRASQAVIDSSNRLGESERREAEARMRAGELETRVREAERDTEALRKSIAVGDVSVRIDTALVAETKRRVIAEQAVSSVSRAYEVQTQTETVTAERLGALSEELTKERASAETLRKLAGVREATLESVVDAAMAKRLSFCLSETEKAVAARDEMQKLHEKDTETLMQRCERLVTENVGLFTALSQQEKELVVLEREAQIARKAAAAAVSVKQDKEGERAAVAKRLVFCDSEADAAEEEAGRLTSALDDAKRAARETDDKDSIIEDLEREVSQREAELQEAQEDKQEKLARLESVEAELRKALADLRDAEQGRRDACIETVGLRKLLSTAQCRDADEAAQAAYTKRAAVWGHKLDALQMELQVFSRKLQSSEEGAVLKEDTLLRKLQATGDELRVALQSAHDAEANAVPFKEDVAHLKRMLSETQTELVAERKMRAATAAELSLLQRLRTTASSVSEIGTPVLDAALRKRVVTLAECATPTSATPTTGKPPRAHRRRFDEEEETESTATDDGAALMDATVPRTAPWRGAGITPLTALKPLGPEDVPRVASSSSFPELSSPVAAQITPLKRTAGGVQPGSATKQRRTGPASKVEMPSSEDGSECAADVAIRKMSATMQPLKDSLGDAEARAAVLVKRLAVSENERTVAVGEVRRLAASLADVQASLDRTGARVSELDNALRFEKQKSAGLQRTLMEKSARIEALEAEIADVRTATEDNASPSPAPHRIRARADRALAETMKVPAWLSTQQGVAAPEAALPPVPVHDEDDDFDAGADFGGSCDDPMPSPEEAKPQGRPTAPARRPQRPPATPSRQMAPPATPKKTPGKGKSPKGTPKGQWYYDYEWVRGEDGVMRKRELVAWTEPPGRDRSKAPTPARPRKSSAKRTGRKSVPGIPSPPGGRVCSALPQGSVAEGSVSGWRVPAALPQPSVADESVADLGGGDGFSESDLGDPLMPVGSVVDTASVASAALDRDCKTCVTLKADVSKLRMHVRVVDEGLEEMGRKIERQERCGDSTSVDELKQARTIGVKYRDLMTDFTQLQSQNASLEKRAATAEAAYERANAELTGTPPPATPGSARKGRQGRASKPAEPEDITSDATEVEGQTPPSARRTRSATGAGAKGASAPSRKRPRR